MMKTSRRIGITGPQSTVFRYLKEFYIEDDVKVDTLGTSEKVSKLRHCNLILNLASFTDVRHSGIYRKACWHSNVELVRNLHELCSTQNIPLIHMSTNFVRAFNFNPNLIIGFDTWNYYSQTKLIAELIIGGGEWQNWTIVRTDSIFGKNAKGIDKKFVGKAMEGLKANKEFVLNQVSGLRPTYAKHLAKSLWIICRGILDGQVTLNGYYTDIMNSTNFNEIVTLEDYFKWICAFAGYNVVYKINNEEDPVNFGCNNSFRPEMPHWKQALEEYIKEEWK